MSRLLLSLTVHPDGRDQLTVWNVIARVDPNMRKMRGMYFPIPSSIIIKMQLLLEKVEIKSTC